MRIAFAVILCAPIAFSGAFALGDLLVLKQGGTVEGTVTIEGDTVLVTRGSSTFRYPRSEVARIEWQETPESQIARRLAATDPNDPNALAALAAWANTVPLPDKAREVYQRVLALDPNHPDARRALGFLRVDAQWRSADQALELARSRLQAGRCDELVRDLLPALEPVLTTREQKLAALELRAEALLRRGSYPEARKAFIELAEVLGPAKGTRSSAVASLLAEHPDGMFVLQDPYPPTAVLLPEDREVLPAGPAPLSHPLALAAALLQQARPHLTAGQDAIKDATALTATDPDAAKAKYLLAEKAFDRADALVPGLARSHRIEMARRRISVLRNDAAAGAKKFDDEKSSLAEKPLTPAAYRNKILRLIYLLDRVRDDLKEILKIAEPYSRELYLEVQWAELDLKTMDSLRKILTEELDAKN